MLRLTIGILIAAVTSCNALDERSMLYHAVQIAANPFGSLPLQIFKLARHKNAKQKQKTIAENTQHDYLSGYYDYLDPARYLGQDWYKEYQNLTADYFQECPSFTPMEDFDMYRYADRWNHGYTNWYLITSTDQKNKEFFNSSTNMCNYHVLSINGYRYIYLDFLSDQVHLNHKWLGHDKDHGMFKNEVNRPWQINFYEVGRYFAPGNWLYGTYMDKIYHTYQVLDTDYDSYAILYNCYAPYVAGTPRQGLWILARDPSDGRKIMQIVRERLLRRFNGPEKEKIVDYLLAQLGPMTEFPNTDEAQCQFFRK